MARNAKYYLAAGIFLVCWVLYLLLPSFFQYHNIVKLTDIFENESANFIFLMFSLLAISLGLSELLHFFYDIIRKLVIFKPKIGKVLVTRGYITEEQLKEALVEQSLKIGEILIEAGHITMEQLNKALKYQKKSGKKLGEVLKELGYSTDVEIHWASKKVKRKLGKILVDKGLLTYQDVKRIMGRIYYEHFRR